MGRRSLVTALAVTTLFASACGGPSEQEAADALFDGLVEPSALGVALDDLVPGLTRAGYECVANGLVTEIGTGALLDQGVLVAADGEELGLNPDATLGATESWIAAEIVFDCGGLRDKFLSTARGPAEDAPENLVNCIDVGVDYDLLKGPLALALQGRTAESNEAAGNFEQTVDQLAQKCRADAATEDVNGG